MRPLFRRRKGPPAQPDAPIWPPEPEGEPTSADLTVRLSRFVYENRHRLLEPTVQLEWHRIRMMVGAARLRENGLPPNPGNDFDDPAVVASGFRPVAIGAPEETVDRRLARIEDDLSSIRRNGIPGGYSYTGW
jgi:hypothetical protein